MPAATPPLMQTEGLCISYRSRGASVAAVQDVSIVVRAGESVALVTRLDAHAQALRPALARFGFDRLESV